MVNDSNGAIPAPQELETFISPDEKKKERIVSKYNLTKDAESGEFDPFAERKLDNPTSDMDTLTHLLKASLGTGILTMPKAFKMAGLANGIMFTVFVAVICTHCSYILVKCAHVLYKKTKRTQMSFAEVGEAALQNGPEPLRRWANAFRIFIIISLFVTYFGTCSVYTVIIAANLLEVIKYYTGTDIAVRLMITILLVPLILLAWIRNLKYLAPVSMLANVLMGIGLGITMYFLVGTGELKVDQMKDMLFNPPSGWPEFFSITVFAMEAIGVVMPLENSMKTPRSMLGICGVMNKGMSGVTLLYILLGFLGYLRFGDAVQDSITLNLDDTIFAQIVKLAIAVAVFCTFGLQFFVCIDIMWKGIKDRFTKRPELADYIMRTIMVTVCVLIAVAVPKISPLVGVIGAFCFSILGLIAPALIEIITFWDIGFGPTKYLIWKNVLVMIVGTFSLIFGTKDAILAIVN